MRVDYEGDKEPEYPQKLKRRIEAILEHPELLELSTNNVTLAKEYFDYSGRTFETSHRGNDGSICQRERKMRTALLKKRSDAARNAPTRKPESPARGADDSGLRLVDAITSPVFSSAIHSRLT